MDTTEVEARLLGACLLHPPTVKQVAAEVRVEEFTYPPFKAVYAAMVNAGERQVEFDQATLLRRLVQAGMEEPNAADAIMRVYGAQTNPWAVGEYIALVHEEGRWERIRRATALLGDAGQNRDDAGYEQAMALLTERPGGGWEESQESLYDDVIERLEGKRGTYLLTPFAGLNMALGGGMVPGEVTVVGGWTSHAKSVLVMQTADRLVEEGADALYMTNEMRRDEVALRVLAGHGGPPFHQLRAGGMNADQWGKVLKAMGSVALKIINAAGRACEEVCAYIASRKPDLAVIDLFNRLPRRQGTGTRELDDQVSRICDTAARSGAHVLLVSQLNRARLSASKEFPHPTLGDLRDTGALETHPANVLFSYLTNDEGIREGYVEVAKARNGQVGYTMPVTLNPNRMRLIPSTLT